MAKETQTEINLSSREIHELLETAKALGVVRLELRGLKFEFGDSAPAAPSEELAPPTREHGPECEVCGDEKRPSVFGKGYYCVACYKRSKDGKKS